MASRSPSPDSPSSSSSSWSSASPSGSPYPDNVFDASEREWNEQQDGKGKRSGGVPVAVVVLLMLLEAFLLPYLAKTSCAQLQSLCHPAHCQHQRPIVLEPLPVVSELLDLSASYAELPTQVIAVLLEGADGRDLALALKHAGRVGDSIVDVLRTWYMLGRTDITNVRYDEVIEADGEMRSQLRYARDLISPAVVAMNFWLLPVASMVETVQDVLERAVASQWQDGMADDTIRGSPSATGIPAANASTTVVLDVLWFVSADVVEQTNDYGRRLRTLKIKMGRVMECFEELNSHFRRVFVDVEDEVAEERWRAVLENFYDKDIRRIFPMGHRWTDGEYHAETGLWQGFLEAFGRKTSTSAPTAKTEAATLHNTVMHLREAHEHLTRLANEYIDLKSRMEGFARHIDDLRNGKGWISPLTNEEMEVRYYMPPVPSLLPEVRLALDRLLHQNGELHLTVKALEERNSQRNQVDYEKWVETERREQERVGRKDPFEDDVDDELDDDDQGRKEFVPWITKQQLDDINRAITMLHQARANVR